MTQPGSGTAAPSNLENGHTKNGHGAQGKRRKDKHKLGFRPDVEGLRAIAVVLVLLYHAKLAGLPGGFVGVDVFFVISGFLITTLLLNELDRRGTISLTEFYARRAKRLLPAAAVVLVATTVMTLTLMPRHRWNTAGGDIVSSALYVVNWRFADRSVDYLAEGLAPSPVQHFWSLAVEEQFYLVWPLLMLGAALLARRLHNNRLALGAALAAVAIPSLVWSVTYTASTPAKAFFVTTTRMWELAAGAAVAVAATLLPRIPRAVALTLGWGGVATIVVVGLTVSPASAWPGYAAVFPVLGAAAVIAAGPAAGPYGPTALIGTAPFRWVGGLSYSLYLWHWPMLVVAEERWEGLGTGGRLLVVAASFLPAWLTLKLVENPVRFSTAISRRPRLALGIGANCTAVGAAAGMALVMMVGATTPAAPVVTLATAQHLGAGTLTSAAGRAAAAVPVDFVKQITPDPAVADKDIPDIYDLGCQVHQDSAKPVACYFGPADAKTTIAVVGDSKAGQWLPALQLLAEANKWRVITYTKSSCPLTSADLLLDGKIYTSCRDWNAAVMGLLTRPGPDRPEFVLTSQAFDTAVGPKGNQSRKAMRAGLAESWKQLTKAGVQVLVLADNPHPDMEVWQCASENLKSLSKCAFDRKVGTVRSAAVVQKETVAALGGKAVGLNPRASRDTARGTARTPLYIDLVDLICPGTSCPPVIGSVLVYRQGSHLTATYVTTLAPRLEQALRAAGVPSARVAARGVQAAGDPPLPEAPGTSGVTARTHDAPAVAAADKPSPAKPGTATAAARAAEPAKPKAAQQATAADARPKQEEAAPAEPRPRAPAAAEPKATAPKTTAPKTTAPKTTAPKTTAPKTTAPNSTEPKAPPAQPAQPQEQQPAPEPAPEQTPEEGGAKPAPSDPLGGLVPPRD